MEQGSGLPGDLHGAPTSSPSCPGVPTCQFPVGTVTDDHRWWIKMTYAYSLTVPEARRPKLRCWRGSRKHLFLASPSFWWLLVLPCGRVTSVSSDTAISSVRPVSHGLVPAEAMLIWAAPSLSAADCRYLSGWTQRRPTRPTQISRGPQLTCTLLS